MTIFADTSVLVAALVESHPAHQRTVPLLQKAHSGKAELVVSTHTLAELYAVLTRLPLHPRINPQLARSLVRENVEAVAKVVPLGAREYREVLDQLARLGLAGGVVYDALAAKAAQKAKVDRLLTLNESDFRRVWPDAGARIATP
ncbi:MAG: PIN domain-containing protein [Verrucomicrobiota bacterium]